MGKKLEPKISNLDNIENEVVVMRPLGGSSSSSSLSSYWPLLGIVVAIISIGYVWLSSAEKKNQIDLALAAKTAQEQAKTQEIKQREAFYEGMNEQTLTNQEQEAENARIAWENYNQEQKRREIFEMEQRKNVSVESFAPSSSQSNEESQTQTRSYWKCTDDTGVTTYSIEPCHIETIQPEKNPSLKFVPQQKEIRIADTQHINIIHNPTPAPRVTTNTVIAYRDSNTQPDINKMESIDCQNAKRAYKFEKDNRYGKQFNMDRIRSELIEKCGGWPSSL